MKTKHYINKRILSAVLTVMMVIGMLIQPTNIKDVYGAEKEPLAERWTAISEGQEYKLLGNKMYDMWVSPTGTVFACGVEVINYDKIPCIYVYKNNEWKKYSTDTTIDSADSMSISGTSDDNVYMAVDNNIVHFDGTEIKQCVKDKGKFYKIYDIVCVSSTEAYAVGEKSLIYKLDPSNNLKWSMKLFRYSSVYNKIYVKAFDDIYSTGDNNYILHYDGSNWTPMSIDESVKNYTFNAIENIDGNIYAAGYNILLKYDETEKKWKVVSNANNGDVSFNIFGTSSSDIYVFNSNELSYYDGSSWITGILTPKNGIKYYINTSYTTKEGDIYLIFRHECEGVQKYDLVVIEKTPSPDLTVENIKLEHAGSTIYKDTDVTVKAVVKNQGKGNAEGFKASLSSKFGQENFNEVEAIDIPFLVSNEQTEISFKWTPGREGSFVLKVQANSGDNPLKEILKDNNKMLEENITVLGDSAKPRPDLRVKSISTATSPSSIKVGQETVVTVKIENLGNAPVEGSYYVKLYTEYPKWEQIALVTTDSAIATTAAAVTGSAIVKFNWTPSYNVNGKVDLYALVDSNNSILEKDETNNLLKIPVELLTIFDLDLSVLPTEAGNITADKDVHKLDYNTKVQLTAVTNEGYVFKSWSGGISGNNNPAKIVMDSDKSVQAIFEPAAYDMSLEPIVLENYKFKEYYEGIMPRVTCIGRNTGNTELKNVVISMYQGTTQLGKKKEDILRPNEPISITLENAKLSLNSSIRAVVTFDGNEKDKTPDNNEVIFDEAVKPSVTQNMIHMTTPILKSQTVGMVEGPSINNVIAFSPTELYASTNCGVLKYMGKGVWKFMEGADSSQEDSAFRKPFIHIEGSSSSDMTALEYNNASDTVWHYDGNRWTVKANSSISTSNYNDATLILDENNIYLSVASNELAYYDGTKWSNNIKIGGENPEITSFVKIDSKTAYAGGKNLYKYASGAWAKLAEGKTNVLSTCSKGIYVSRDGEIQLMSFDGKNIISRIAYPGQYAPTSLYENKDGIIYAVFTLEEGIADINYVFRYDNQNWNNLRIPDSELEGRNHSFTGIASPIEDHVYFLGNYGTFYMLAYQSVITFDANGGTLYGSPSISGIAYNEISSEIKLPSATRAGYIFGGWYYDKNGTQRWNRNEDTYPAENITIYAKWIPKGAGVDELTYHRQSALESLAKQFKKYSQSDYSVIKWAELSAAYNAGIKAINEAVPADEPYIENNIIAALNMALQAMGAIDPDRAGQISIAVSMDANTLGLGYIIKPTLVSCTKYTQASEVITDLLKENGYKWENTGDISSSFYLAQVYDVDQINAEVAGYIVKAAGSSTINYDDRMDKKLGEFDYNSMSGWMYSVGDYDNKTYPSFPGVGASDWRMSHGEVMRWQFTVYGYGSDLNADNSAWGNKSIVPNLGNKSALTWEVASLRDKYEDLVLEKNKEYNEAMKALINPEANQRTVDNALKALKNMKLDDVSINPVSSNSGVIKTEITCPATVKNGTAIAKLTESQMKTAIESASRDNAKIIVIAPTGTDNVDKTVVEIPKTSISDIISDTAAVLCVETSIANVTIAQDGLLNLAKKQGSDISITSEKKKDGSIAITVAVGGKDVDKIVGDLKVSVPVTDGLVAVLIKSDGSKSVIKKSVVENGEAYLLLEGSATIKIINNTKDFSDVKADDWYKSAVDFASSHELFNGTNSKTFGPNAPMTRAMLVTVLYRLENEPEALNSGFGDVSEDSYYKNAVAWAARKEIIKGISANEFAPNSIITREQLVSIMHRYAVQFSLSTIAKGDLTKYTDSKNISGWARKSMEWAVGLGLVSGRGDNNLEPNGTATRAEVAAILQRFASLIVK